MRAIHDTFYKRSKQTCSSSIVELYKHLGIFKNTREVREAIVLGSSPHLSHVLKNSRVPIELDNALGVFFSNFLVIARSLVSFGVNNKTTNCACRADSCNFVTFEKFTHT